MRIDEIDSDKFVFLQDYATGTANGTGTTDIDYLISANKFIYSMRILVNNGVWGDYLAGQVVDKDNILGGGAGAILYTFITRFHICSDKQDQGTIFLLAPSEGRAGLYLRFKYTGVGGILSFPQVRLNITSYDAIDAAEDI